MRRRWRIGDERGTQQPVAPVPVFETQRVFVGALTRGLLAGLDACLDYLELAARLPVKSRLKRSFPAVPFIESPVTVAL